MKFITFADYFSSLTTSLISLSFRLWVGAIFWKSGLTKIASWDATLFLFESEYKVPLLPPNVAAYLSTFAELTFPVLLILGFGARIAAIGLLVMTAVIQFTYLHSPMHLIWALILLALIIQGPGRFSWDYFIRLRTRGDQPQLSNPGLLVAILLSIFITLAVLHDVAIPTFGPALGIEWHPWLETWENLWNSIKESSP